MQKRLRNEIEEAVNVIHSGGIIIYPTETFYAIGCDPFNKNTIKKVFQLKAREKWKPLPLIACSIDMVNEFAILNEKNLKLAQNFWPGPLTLILPQRITFPQGYISKNKKIAIRISSNEIARSISKTLSKPIVSTSANIADERPFVNLKKIKGLFGKKIDYYVNGGILKGEKPSTIIEYQSGKLKVLREGAIVLKCLEKYL